MRPASESCCGWPARASPSAPVEVLQDLYLEVRRGEFVALVGPSGCGKTTLLNLCSGWLRPQRGQRPSARAACAWSSSRTASSPGSRWARTSAWACGTWPTTRSAQRRARALLALVGLQGFEDHYPHQLSGGMRQRVELARALAGDTDLLLMDEPFSSLDYLTRLRMRGELARLLREQPRTVVLVTHDIEEAAQLADRVLVLIGAAGPHPRRGSPRRRRGRATPREPRSCRPCTASWPSWAWRASPAEPVGAAAGRSLRDALAAPCAWAWAPSRSCRAGPAAREALAAAAEGLRGTAARETLAVGFLPVTCHLTCPVTDYASKTSRRTRFESQRFTDFPTVVETVKSGRLDATFMIAPLAMKLREQGSR